MLGSDVGSNLLDETCRDHCLISRKARGVGCSTPCDRRPHEKEWRDVARPSTAHSQGEFEPVLQLKEMIDTLEQKNRDEMGKKADWPWLLGP